MVDCALLAKWAVTVDGAMRMHEKSRRCFWCYLATYASENDIGDEGATALVLALDLERNSMLQHLNVAGRCDCFVVDDDETRLVHVWSGTHEIRKRH
jgi:hypothetical protein